MHAYNYKDRYLKIYLGPSGGFFFGAQFIQEDWTPGPNFYGEGFRIAIHPPGTTEYNLVDNGFSVRPKLTTEVALSQQQEIYLVSSETILQCKN